MGSDLHLTVEETEARALSPRAGSAVVLGGQLLKRVLGGLAEAAALGEGWHPVRGGRVWWVARCTRELQGIPHRLWASRASAPGDRGLSSRCCRRRTAE